MPFFPRGRGTAGAFLSREVTSAAKLLSNALYEYHAQVLRALSRPPPQPFQFPPLQPF